ncbi:MAG: class I SAM-dependent methyltransferase [Firmicutes bacterium]|nr:class I SAM-dependent methyltransferase [Bacillota bacterium]
MRAVDLGAGDGYLSMAVAKLVKSVYAVDISGEMLKELRKKAKEAGIRNIETIESDGCDVPLEDAGADVVCASMYMHHIEEPENAVKEINRMLKPGGQVFLADFYLHDDMEFKEKMHDIWPGFNTDAIKQLFEKNGFKDIKIEALDDIDPAKVKKKYLF